MANITESSPAMTDTAVRTGVRITFVVLDPDDYRAIGVAESNGRGTPNLRDRVFVETVFQALRSDGRPGQQRVTKQQHVDTANYPALSVGTLLAGLKVIHDTDQAREDLSP